MTLFNPNLERRRAKSVVNYFIMATFRIRGVRVSRTRCVLCRVSRWTERRPDGHDFWFGARSARKTRPLSSSRGLSRPSYERFQCQGDRTGELFSRFATIVAGAAGQQNPPYVSDNKSHFYFFNSNWIGNFSYAGVFRIVMGLTGKQITC